MKDYVQHKIGELILWVPDESPLIWNGELMKILKPMAKAQGIKIEHAEKTIVYKKGQPVDSRQWDIERRSS